MVFFYLHCLFFTYFDALPCRLWVFANKRTFFANNNCQDCYLNSLKRVAGLMDRRNGATTVTKKSSFKFFAFKEALKINLKMALVEPLKGITIKNKKVSISQSQESRDKRFTPYCWIISKLANRVPALPGKNLMSLRHPSRHFILHKVFSPVICLGFGVRGLGWRDHACVKNLPWVGREVCAKFGGDWFGSSGVKRVDRYMITNSLFYIYR